MKRSPGLTVEQAREKIYSQRVESKARRNPDATLAEARGHKPPPLPETATNAEKQKRALQEWASALSLQQKTGRITGGQVKEAQRILRQMSREVSKMEKRGKGKLGETPSDLEWTLWSQQQKERQLQAENLLGRMPDKTKERAGKILQRMQEVTKNMWEKHPPGKPSYYRDQERLAALYKRLEKLGLVHRTGDILQGDVGYH